MAISERLKSFLATSRVTYTVMKHPTVYTAQEIAAAQHVPGKQLAKCVLVKTDRGPVLAVLPASFLIDLPRLKALLRATSVSIAKEADINTLFPDVEVGSMSPFGNLYDVPVVIERVLGESEEIVFNAGSHTDTIKMRSRDVAALVKPKTGSFGQPFGGPKKKRRAPKKSPPRGKARPKAARRGRKSPSPRR